MPVLSIVFIKTSLVYFIIGIIFGGILLINKAYNFDQALWILLPIHVQILFLGWTLQFVFGVAFWILPRYIYSYGKTEFAWACYVLLNSGILLSIFSYINNVKLYTENSKLLFIFSALLIFLGILLFFIYIWFRVKPFILDEAEKVSKS